MKTRKKNKGFTLIELIVVIAILAILAAVAVPSYMKLIERANTAVQVASAAEYANAINVYNTLNPDDEDKIVQDDLTIEGASNVVTILTEAELKPVLDAAAEDKLDEILDRIEIDDETGIATVTDKE